MTTLTVCVDYLSPIVARYHSRLINSSYTQAVVEGAVVTYTLEVSHDAAIPNTVKEALNRDTLAGRVLSVTIIDLHRSVFDEVVRTVAQRSAVCHSYGLGRPSQCWVTATY